MDGSVVVECGVRTANLATVPEGTHGIRSQSRNCVAGASFGSELHRPSVQQLNVTAACCPSRSEQPVGQRRQHQRPCKGR